MSIERPTTMLFLGGRGAIGPWSNMYTDRELCYRCAQVERNGKINREASMLVFTRAMKMAAAAVSLAVMLLGAATSSQAQTTGHVCLHIVKVGFIVGVGGGSCVLFYYC